MFKQIADLEIGQFDAVNYDTRAGKNFLKRVFFRDNYLDRIVQEGRYFLVGEKGTGKTAYATFLSNEEYSNNACDIRRIVNTDYDKFVSLKKAGHIPVSSLTSCWKVILLLLMSENLYKTEKTGLFTDKFRKIRAAIDEYYDSAFDPEVVSALEYVEDVESNAKIISKFFGLEERTKLAEKTARSEFQISLASVERSFKEAISSLRLAKNHIIFIDGIDIRPSDISFGEYVSVIRALANAVWDLNKDFFGKIKDSPGRAKIVLLIRPDIFEAVEFHNANTKIRDNAVILDWKTTYKDFRGSRIFAMTDGLLAKQEGHPPMELGAAWAHYFPYDVPNMRVAEKLDDPFITFLRTSFYRPRDIIAYLDIIKEYVSQYRPDADSFTDDDYLTCQRQFSDYLLGEVKDHLSFYHSSDDFERLVSFFDFLGGKGRFSWEAFVAAHQKFMNSSKGKSLTLGPLTGGASDFMQLLYSMNVVGYEEVAVSGPGKFVHWYFRDRTTVKLNPQAPTNVRGTTYVVHPGLLRALKLSGENN